VLPRKSDTNLIFASSALFTQREQWPLLLVLRVSDPEQSLSKPEPSLSIPE
jgi:hypothetical protein